MEKKNCEEPCEDHRPLSIPIFRSLTCYPLSVLRLIVIMMAVRIFVLLPTPYPPIKLFWRPWADRVGRVEFMELVRAIFEVGRVVPHRIVLIPKPFDMIL